MKTVKRVCKFCGRAEQYSRWEYVGKVALRSLQALLEVLGVFFIAYLILVGWQTPIENVMNAEFTNYANDYSSMMRTKTIEVTEECDGADPKCYAEAVFEDLKDIRYVPNPISEGRLYPPMYVYENGGDCKNVASLYVAMLRSVGISSSVDCSAEHTHCVAVVPDKDRSVNYVVDLTMPSLTPMGIEEDVWQYYGWDDTD